MTTHTFPITRPVAGPGTGDDRPSRSTPSRRIAAGAVAGPVFVAASFAQLPFQSGFDVTRHAFSFLLLGATGWVEEVTFIVAGALFVAGAVGIRRVLGGRAGAVALLGSRPVTGRFTASRHYSNYKPPDCSPARIGPARCCCSMNKIAAAGTAS